MWCSASSDALNSVKKPINGSRIHLFGVAYKKDVGDVRESPALDIIELLVRRGAEVTYTDPYVPTLSHAGHDLESVPFDMAIDVSVRLCRDCNRPPGVRLRAHRRSAAPGRHTQRAEGFRAAVDIPPVDQVAE